MATLAALAAIASACSQTNAPPPVVVKVVETTIPAEARKPCAAPVALPDRDLTQSEATAAWGRDRANLRICEKRRAAAVAAIKAGAPK
jgi:hypothetical protein